MIFVPILFIPPSISYILSNLFFCLQFHYSNFFLLLFARIVCSVDKTGNKVIVGKMFAKCKHSQISPYTSCIQMHVEADIKRKFRCNGDKEIKGLNRIRIHIYVHIHMDECIGACVNVRLGTEFCFLSIDMSDCYSLLLLHILFSIPRI